MGPFRTKKSLLKSNDHNVARGQVDKKIYPPLEENAFQARKMAKLLHTYQA